MVLSICNLRSTLVSKFENIRGIGFLYLMAAAVASAVFMTGCSSAVGTDLAPREDILKTLRAQGFVFNKYVISTVFGENQNQVIVSGQIAQKTPDNQHVTNGTKLTQYRKVVVENVDGTWKVISAPPLQREQFSSRQY